MVTRRRDPGLQISGRRAELDRIFHSTGLQVIGLHECRAKTARRLEGEHFYMISEPADAKGRGGCELWVTKELRPNKRNVRLLHSEPELLLASLELPKCRCFVLVFHAPPGVCWRAGKAIMVATLHVCCAGVRCGHRCVGDDVRRQRTGWICSEQLDWSDGPRERESKWTTATPNAGGV